MDQTCIDTDDDDLEFDNAEKEENEDQATRALSAFMVSQHNVSRYQEMTQQILETDALEEDEEDEDPENAAYQQSIMKGQQRVVKPPKKQSNMILEGLDKPEIPRVQLEKMDSYKNQQFKINPSSVGSYGELDNNLASKQPQQKTKKKAVASTPFAQANESMEKSRAQNNLTAQSINQNDSHNTSGTKVYDDENPLPGSP